MASVAGTKAGTGYVDMYPDFSRFQERVGRQLNQALAPVMQKAGGRAGKDLARGIDRGGFGQMLRQRFSRIGDDAGKELAAKVSKGAKRAEGDMFGLADAVREVERNQRKASRSSKALGGDMFGIGKAAKEAGRGIAFSRRETDSWTRRADGANASSRTLRNRIKGLGYEFGSLSKGIRTSSGGFSGFDGVMARVNRSSQFFRNILRTIKWPVFIAGLGLSLQGLSALAAGAVAAASALGSLSGLMVALPAAALAGAQALGAFKLATAGVTDTVKAAFAAEVKGGTQATDVLRQQRDATERVADAKRNLINVQEQAEKAQDDLREARESATRQLQDMRLAAEASGTSERQAALSLREARRELARTLADPSSSGLDVQGAELAVEQAREDLEGTRLEAKRAREDYKDAQKSGVDGMPEVVAAKEAEADANQAVTDAQRDLRRATEDATAAMENQGSAATALQEKMSQLPPAGQKFVRFLVSLKPRLDSLRATAAKGFLPGAEKGLKGALRNFGVFRGLIDGTSKSLGRLAAKAGDRLGSAVWGRDLSRLGKLNTRIIDRMGDAGLNLADALRRMLVSAEPFLDWLSEGVKSFSQWIKQEAAAGRESGRLAEFFDRTRETMERVWPILKGVGGALLNIGEAARPLGNEILDSLGNAAEGWRKWTDSTKGQNRLKTYFTETKPAIFEMGRLIRDAGKAFFELGKQEGVAELLRLVRTQLIPATRDLVGGTTGWASKFLGEFGELRDEGVPAFDALIQTLVDHAAEAGVKLAKALVRAFFNSGPLGKLFIGGWLISKFGGGGAFARVGESIGRSLGFGIGGGVEGVAKGPLRSRLLSAGKRLGIAFAAYGFFEGARTAFSDNKGAKDLADHLHNAGVGFFRSFGVDIGETTAEEFSTGFKKRIESLAASGFLGRQSIITPEIEERARSKAEGQVDRKYPGRGGIGLDDVPEFDLLYQRALSELMRTVQARRASTKEIFRDFWDDMGPDERVFAKQLRQALVQSDKLLQRTGVKLPQIRLEQNPKQSAQATKKILGDFTFLRKGIGTNVRDINKVSHRAGRLIVETFGRGSNEARELTSRNMRLTAQAMADAMVRSGNVTMKGFERIQQLIRNARLIDPSRKQARAFGDEWARGMDRTKEINAKGLNAMIREANRMPGPMRKAALETWFEHIRQARKSGDLTADAFRKLRSRMFSEFGTIQRDTKAFNREFAKGFVDMVNESGGAMGLLMSNLSSVLKAVGDKGKLDYTIKKAARGGGESSPPGRQMGGPIARAVGGLAATVPGTSTGDRHILSLNGRPVAKVESKEGIFVGNRNLMGALHQANAEVPRFQKGGQLGPEPIIAGPNGALRSIGQQAVSKVYEGAKSFLDKQGGLGGSGGGIASAGPLKQFSRSYPEHTLFNADGRARFSEALVARIARWAGLPGRLFGQVAHGESNFYPGVFGIDPGGTEGLGLWQITTGYNDARIRKWGGRKQMFNPLKNAKAAKEIYDEQGLGAWYGLDFVTGMKQGGLLRGAAGRLKGRFGSLARLAGGGMVDPIWDPGGEVINSSIAQLVGAYAKRFDIDITAGYDPGGGHVSPGHNSTGTATDVVPRDGNWDGAFAKGLETLTGMGFEVLYDGSHGTVAYPNHGRGNHAHIEWVGNGTAADARQRLRDFLGGVSGAPTGGSAAASKEKIPAKYKGAKTGILDFGPKPTTVKEVDKQIAKWQKEAPVYRKARAYAESHDKPATAQAIGQNVTKIEERLAALRSLRTQLRLKEVRKRLTSRIGKAFGRFGDYDQLIEGSQLAYEKASQDAEQIVGLEPLSPELPAGATDVQREAAEKSYVAQFTSYVDTRERPAYQAVLDRVADWRNNILRAERFGFGKGRPSVATSEGRWEGKVRGVRQRIEKIRRFSDAVQERVDRFKRNHPKEALPDWLKKQVAERNEMRKELPALKLRDNRLSDAVLKARDIFFPGGENRLEELPMGKAVRLPLAGSGSLEEKLREVQGIHWPEQHELLSSGDIGGTRTAGRFGGVIWDVQTSIEELGLKISQAANGIGGGDGDGEEGEDESLLRELLTQKNQEQIIRQIEERVLGSRDQFPPYAGKAHTGAIVPGPANQERTMILRGNEGIFTEDQRDWLLKGMPAARTNSLPPVTVNVYEDTGEVEVKYGEKEAEATVNRLQRRQSRNASRRRAGRPQGRPF